MILASFRLCCPSIKNVSKSPYEVSWVLCKRKPKQCHTLSKPLILLVVDGFWCKEEEEEERGEAAAASVVVQRLLQRIDCGKAWIDVRLEKGKKQLTTR